MRPRLRDLPVAVLNLAMALARGERNEVWQISQFVRGLAIQVSFRHISGDVLVSGKSQAALLWSRLDGPRAGAFRTTAAMLMAAAVGVILCLLSNALLLVPVGAALRLAGVSTTRIAYVALAIPSFRLLLTAYRAVKTYALERRRQRRMPAIETHPRWRLDLMGSNPPGSGHGASLLREFVALADAAGATVYLVTEPHNQQFYRRGGFRVVPSDASCFAGMRLMRRVAPVASVPTQRLSGAAQPALR